MKMKFLPTTLIIALIFIAFANAEDSKLLGKWRASKLKMLKDLLDENPYSIYVFSNKDTCWVYLVNGFIELHAREYYTRIKMQNQTK